MASEVETVAAESVLSRLPLPRIKPYRQAAGDDAELALKLYSWNARMSGACLEQLAHLEVLLRHTIDTQLERYAREDKVKIPWFLLPPFVSAQDKTIEQVRTRLRGMKQETRDQIVAGLSFGYWSGWLGAKYEELWRQALYKGFPNGSGRRSDVTKLAEQVRKFRNRIAHHDSLLTVDVGFEMQSVFQLAEIIDTDVAQWMRTVDRTREVGLERPVVLDDVVVVPARNAWSFYRSSHAYICPAGRYFRPVEYMAFYVDRQIMPEIAKIKSRIDYVAWNWGEVKRLEGDDDRNKRRLGKVMAGSLSAGWDHGAYQVFLLSQPGETDHVSLAAPLRNLHKGRASAHVRKHRYTSVHLLRHAKDTQELWA